MAVALTPGQPSSASADRPRTIVAPVVFSDMVFRGILRAAGLAVLLITALILVFLIFRSVSALKAVGLGFFTTSTWFIGTNQFGIAAILPLGILAALFALFIAVPVGIATALFISEYAPPRLRRALIAMMDLMAAVPSIIVALFAVFFLMPRILGFDAWLSHHMAFIPLFQFRLANYPGNYANATFIAGVAVSLLVIPIVASLSRQVFSQAPQGEREAAYALGSTRWGMIRTVVLPYGRSGVIGAGMLGLGRALGGDHRDGLHPEPGLRLQLPRAGERRQLGHGHDRKSFLRGRCQGDLRADGRRPCPVRDDPGGQHLRRDDHQPVTFRRDRIGGLRHADPRRPARLQG